MASKLDTNTNLKNFLASLQSSLNDDQIILDYARRFALSTDASFYRLTPEIIVRIEDEQQLSTLLNLAGRFYVPITFRAAGTSLSGQAITDSVLVMLGSLWNNVKVTDDGKQIHLQPGVIAAEANLALEKYGRKIGPDPASINVCKIGGIVANNASGMCCGMANNTYHTLSGIRLLLWDGTILDTRDSASVSAFRKHHSDLLGRLKSLAGDIKSNPDLLKKIQHKYRLKNTTGYSINALIDYNDPIDILAHLMVGSEGTLGFISEVSYNTVPHYSCRATAILFFEDIKSCCNAVIALKNMPVEAVELIDGRGLQAVSDKPGMPMPESQIKALGTNISALLIETSAQNKSGLTQQIEEISDCLKHHKTLKPIIFTTDKELASQWWAIRKGLFPAVGAVRQTGTTVIIEDVAFPIERLSDAVRELQGLFKKFNYDDALIFGHALQGNLHFVFSQSFETDQEKERYRQFMDEVCQMVVGTYDGSLKAEHGTGRNMAPFVELEWGEDAYQIMRSIKQLLDPLNILNPGVLINDDPEVHIQNLKSMPTVSPIIDRCIECGFCEPTCPSKQLSLTPRQRIALFREITRQKQMGSDTSEIEDQYQYLGIDTCAATGLCAERCPVGINTGEFIKELREEKNRRWAGTANFLSNHFGAVSACVRGGLIATDLMHKTLNTDTMQRLTGSIRRLSHNTVPLWVPETPRAIRPKQLQRLNLSSLVTPTTQTKIIYWPSCAARNFAPPRGSDNAPLPEVVTRLLRKAGYAVELLIDSDLCCGQPFESKGHCEIASQKRKQLIDRLSQVSEQGRHLILTDTSPCALQLNTEHSLQIMEPIQFTLEKLTKRLDINPLDQTIALHVTCSTQKQGLKQHAIELAQQCAHEVIVPKEIDCCGFAGDKGFTLPELNASSLSTLRQQVSNCAAGYSTSLTCEIGLSHHSGIHYQSLLYLVDKASH